VIIIKLHVSSWFNPVNEKRQIYQGAQEGTTKPDPVRGSLGDWAGCGHITT